MSTETTPASSDARAPQMTRDSTSRPISSVPNQCAADGALRIALQLVASGSYGATTGASNATHHDEHDHHEADRRAAPAQEPPQRMRARRHAERVGRRGQGVVARRHHCTRICGLTTTYAMSASEVQHDVRRRGEQHDALHDRVVAIEHGVDDQLAEARES